MVISSMGNKYNNDFVNIPLLRQSTIGAFERIRSI